MDALEALARLLKEDALEEVCTLLLVAADDGVARLVKVATPETVGSDDEVDTDVGDDKLDVDDTLEAVA